MIETKIKRRSYSCNHAQRKTTGMFSRVEGIHSSCADGLYHKALHEQGPEAERHDDRAR